MQRLSPRFRSQYFFLWKLRYAEKRFPQSYRDLNGDAMLVHQHGGRKPAETSVTEFLYKRVNLSLEELKNVTIRPYSNARTVQIAEVPEISHFLNQHHSSLGRHVNAIQTKFKRSLSLNQEPIQSENLC